MRHDSCPRGSLSQLRHPRPNSTAKKYPGNSCGRTDSRTEFSNPSTTATPRTNSSIGYGKIISLARRDWVTERKGEKPVPPDRGGGRKIHDRRYSRRGGASVLLNITFLDPILLLLQLVRTATSNRGEPTRMANTAAPSAPVHGTARTAAFCGAA
jgi:hypothetical protein